MNQERGWQLIGGDVTLDKGTMYMYLNVIKYDMTMTFNSNDIM